MNQIEFNNNILVLKVKKSNLFSRLILYVITSLSVILPLGGFFVNLLIGGDLKFFNILFVLLFGIIFFYMLRISLWNTYGKEIIEISETTLNYTADYKWFKDKVKKFDFEEIIFIINKVGYEEDNKGALVIDFNNGTILETVTKIDIENLKNVVSKLNRKYSFIICDKGNSGNTDMRIKVFFTYKDLEGNIAEESIWCIELTNSTFQIDNIPFYVYNIAYKDIISVEEDEGILYFDSLIQTSGHSTIQIIFFDSKQSSIVLKVLESYGCTWEDTIDQSYFAIDIAPDIDYTVIKNYLNSEFDKRVLDYKEACLGIL